MAQLTQQSFNMESAALTTENLRNTMVTVDAMQTANKEIKKQYVDNVQFQASEVDHPVLRYGRIDVNKIEVSCDTESQLGKCEMLIQDRPCMMTWRICLNKPMKSRSQWVVHMLCQMK